MESCLYRREEKLYVEGMEDEDMKKETQNLAYPPAFKLGKIFIICTLYTVHCTLYTVTIISLPDLN